MKPGNNSIITEDGQRLTIQEGMITGTEDSGPGLAYETGNVLDENNRPDNKDRKAGTSSANQKDDRKEDEK
jgi:hypothetical protein